MNLVEKTKHWYRSLPDKKRYFEFITALLTIPVLLTVILANVRTLSNQNINNNQSPSAGSEPRITILPVEIKQSGNAGSPPAGPTGTPAPPKECIRKVGPVEIVYPVDGEVVTKNPVCIDISYSQGDYCSVVWSYRMNGSQWSDYTDKSICLYNVPPGDKTLDVRVKSIAGNDEILLKRNFSVPAVTPSPVATPSGTSD